LAQVIWPLVKFQHLESVLLHLLPTIRHGDVAVIRIYSNRSMA